jgi:hypothetical protein
MFEDTISSLDKDKIKLFQEVALGKAKASVEGVDVFRFLKETILIPSPAEPHNL